MTVKDLAKLAGVSPAAISLVLNGKKGVGEEKRREILEIIKQTGYQHRKKDDSEHANIAFIKYAKSAHIMEENVGFVASMMDGAETACHSAGMSMTVINSVARIGDTLEAMDFDAYRGLVILGTELTQSDWNYLDSIPIPYVVVDNSMPYFDCCCVSINNQENVLKAMRHFSVLGFNEVGYIQGNVNIQNLIERNEGFIAGAKQYHIKVKEENYFEVPPSMLGAFEYFQKYIEEGRRFPPALFAENDTMAIGAMKALTIGGYSIPGDISVIGFDDIHFAKIYSPTITTINVNKHLLGSSAVGLLCRYMENRELFGTKLRLTGEIVVRQSTIQ